MFRYITIDLNLNYNISRKPKAKTDLYVVFPNYFYTVDLLYGGVIRQGWPWLTIPKAQKMDTSGTPVTHLYDIAVT